MGLYLKNVTVIPCQRQRRFVRHLGEAASGPQAAVCSFTATFNETCVLASSRACPGKTVNTLRAANFPSLAFLATPIQVARVRASPRQLPTRRAQHQLFLADSPCAPAHACPAPLPWHLPTGIRAARAPPARSRPRATHSMPSYPRHRASNFRSHTSTNPTHEHGGCDALPSVSRLSSSNHHTFAFPLSQKRASKGKHQRQATACRSLSRH